MKKLSAVLIILFLPHLAFAQSIWMHNRSEMLLETNSHKNFIISYVAPREGLSAQPGDFLVHGTIGFLEKNDISGIARVFSAKCGPIGYEVSGALSDDKKTITLTGSAPIRDANCKITRFKDDKLVFTYAKERGVLDPFFIGEWSANQSTCNEDEAQEGPILTALSPRGLTSYETYCAFTSIKNASNQSIIHATCSSMNQKYSITQNFTKIGNREIEIEAQDGASKGTKQKLFKCPIPLKNAADDSSTASNMQAAEEEYFNRISDEAIQSVKFTHFNMPKQGSAPRR